MKKEKFNAIKALTKKSTQETLSYKELLYQLLIPSNDRLMIDFLDDFFSIKVTNAYNESYLIKNFLDANDSLISSEMKANKTLTLAINELSRVYEPDEKFTNTLETTEYFIKNLIELFLTSEINYLTRLKDLYLIGYDPIADTKRKIVGELLSFDLRKKEYSLNRIKLSGLLTNIGYIVSIFSKLLWVKNTEWREEYYKLIQDQMREKLSTPIHTINKKSKGEENKVGRPGRFKDEQDFHKAVRSIPNWKSLTKTQLSLALRFKSLSGLNEVLKKWRFPK